MVRPIAAGRQRTVLAALLLRANTAVSREELVDALWDEQPPPNALAALRLYVTRLRRALGDGGDTRITGGPAGYRIELADPAELDLLEAEQLWRSGQEAARSGRHERAAELLGRAEQLWHGVPLADVPSERLRRTESARLEELRLQITEARIDADLESGRAGEAVPELRSLVAAHPLRERAHAQLMLALYRAERRGEALAAYSDARRVLREQLGADPSEQLRELHQRILGADPELGRRVPAQAAAPSTATTSTAHPTPRELPPDTASFAGRTDELDRLDELLAHADEQPSVVAITAISGTAGVGKTALAVHWAHTARRRRPDPFPDGCLYLDLRGFDPGAPEDPHDALAALLRSLGLRDDAIPDTQTERAARYRSLLDGRRMLLLLDNARDSEQLRPLLPGSPTCLVLATSHDDLAGVVVQHGVHPMPLDLLGIDDAIELLRHLLGDPRIDADLAAARSLVHQCAGLPLALRIAAAHAAARPDQPLAALAANLTDEQRRLDLLRAGADPRTTIRAVFSWSLTHLAPGQVHAFRVLGLHPGRDLDTYAAAALLDTPLTETSEHLDALIHAHLIHETDPGRYAMHDLLRSYAHEQAIVAYSEHERHAALTRLFDLYLYTAANATDTLYPAGKENRPRIPVPTAQSPRVAEADAARTWLAAEHSNLMDVAAYTTHRGFTTYADPLSDTLTRHLDLTGQYLDAIAMHTHALSAAKVMGDLRGELRALVRLALTYQPLGRHTDAIEVLQKALPSTREVGDRVNERSALINLGTNHWRIGQIPDALNCYQLALPLARETGSGAAESATLVNLGALYHHTGHYAEALEHYRQALALAREIGHRVVEPVALANIGETHYRLGDYPQALADSRRSLTVSREMGNRGTEATALLNLGLIHQSLGDHLQAIAYYKQALDLARDIGNRAAEGYSLAHSGTAHLRFGDYAQALDEGQRALLLADEIGETNLEVEARNSLAETLLVNGQAADAQENHERALALARDSHNRYQEARALDGIAHALQAAGHPDRALQQWNEALTIYTELGVPEAEKLFLRADLE